MAAMKPRPRKPHERPRTLREEIWNLPNVLTLGRIVVIPFVIYLMLLDTRVSAFLATLLFSAAAVTDFLDGWIARSRGLESLWGKFLDPVADKLIVMACTVALVQLGKLPAWLVVLLLARETLITALRGMAQQEGLTIDVIQSGKWKTAFQLVGLVTLLVGHDYEVDYIVWSGTVHFIDIGQALLLGSVVFSLLSAVSYLRSFFVAIVVKEQYDPPPPRRRRLRLPRGGRLFAASRKVLERRRRAHSRDNSPPGDLT